MQAALNVAVVLISVGLVTIANIVLSVLDVAANSE